MRSRRTPTRMGAAGAVVLMVFSAQVVLASGSKANNEFGVAGRTGLCCIVSLRATQHIRTNPAVDPGGDTVAHPFQVYFSSGAFMAVGTYKGAAVGGVSGCAANPSGVWSGYVDGESPAGDYFCHTRQPDAFPAGSSVKVQLSSGTCGAADTGWIALLGGNRSSCKGFYNQDSSGGSAGLEAEGNPINRSYNIDVDHTGYEVQLSFLSSYEAFGADEFNIDRDYRVDTPSASRVDAWFGRRD